MKSFELAVKNIASYGDTDIFPFPIENRVFEDDGESIIELLDGINGDFDQSQSRYSPVNHSMLAPVGYTGFRWATQIDPIWNAYFLSLVIEMGPAIESARLNADREIVHSYRFCPDMGSGALFDKKYGWKSFYEKSVDLAKAHSWVLVCDIADFYSRIYHHRLENALLQLNAGGGVHKKIMTLLQKFSNNASYGLPIGGPAARILSELVLNRTDRLLASGGWSFCRFADDYHIFVDSEEDAYRALVFISEKLLVNEGLSLQKLKTRIMTSREFLANSSADPEEQESSASTFLKISLQFDPYSPNAVEEYEILRKEVDRFDINGLLAKELHKSRIHGPTTRKLIQSIRFLQADLKRDAILSMLRSLETLAPVFGAVMLAIKDAFPFLDGTIQDEVCAILGKLIRSNSHLIKVELNVLYAMRVVALKRSDELEAGLAQLYQSSSSEIVKRDIILIMARWRASYWISDRKSYFYSMGPWERRAFIIASYLLGDEGKHWRDHVKGELAPFELTIRKWASKRFAIHNMESLPL